MATFLELAQELRAQAGVGGTGPTNVETATGIELRLVNYIKNAWIHIQAHPKDWKWMWRPYLAPSPGGAPLQTIINTRDYLLTDVDSLDVDTFISYLTATGVSDRQKMTYIPWESFQQKYSIVDESANRPINVARKPNGDLTLYPKPDVTGYSIEFDYYKTPQILAVNGDIPELPLRYHQLLVFEALKRFGKASDAPEIVQLGEQEGGSEGMEGSPSSGIWRALIWDQEVRKKSIFQEDEQMVVRVE